MKTFVCVVFWWALATLVGIPMAACAQSTPATGLYRFGSFEGSPETVNLGNLNVHLDIPIRHKPGRGMDFAYDLSFDSSVWSVSNGAWTINKDMGWIGSQFNHTSSNLSYNSYQTVYQVQNDCQTSSGSAMSGGPNAYGVYTPAGFLIVYYGFVYTDQYGVPHETPGIVSDYHCQGDVYNYGSSALTAMNVSGPPDKFTPVLAGTAGNFGPAVDGSGVVSSVVAGSTQGGSTLPQVIYTMARGGTTLAFVTTNSGGSSSTVPATIDRNGNTIAFQGAANPYPSIALQQGTSAATITDTLGQTALAISEPSDVTQQSDGATVITSGTLNYSYQYGNGNTSAYVMHYSTYSVKTAFGCSNISEQASTPELMPDYLLQPDGRKYTFTYEPTPGSSGTTTGRIASISFASGGSVSYTYGSPECDGTVLFLTRKVNDGNGNISTWQYSRSLSNNIWTTTETDPLNNQKVLTFQFQGTASALYETGRSEYVGSATTGTILRTTSTASSPSGLFVTTMLPNASGKTSQMDSYYDAYGSPTAVSVFDFGTVGNGVGPLLTSKSMDYAQVGGVMDQLAADITSYYGSNAPPTTIIHGYALDETSVVSSGYGGTIPLTARGNVTSVSTTAINEIGNTSSAMTSKYTYYDTGEVATATDASGQVTTYSYGECNAGFPTGQSQTVKGSGIVLSTSTSWNCIGGVPVSATDLNGNTTTSTYADPYWRLTSTTDALGDVSTLTYPTTSSNSSSTSIAYAAGLPAVYSSATYDGLGRPILAQSRQGPSSSTYTSVASTYDLRGPVSYTSIPYAANSGVYTTSGAGTTYSYDAIGRPLSTVDGDGGKVSYTYNLNDTLVSTGPAPSGENVKSRQLEYNGANQLTSVCEVTSGTGSGSCAQSTSATGYLTQYNYANSLLTSVSENVQAGAAAMQTRSLSYDAFGRKIGETIPETGTSSFVYDSDASGTCSGTSIGDVIKSTDNAGNITCFTYDSLHRPLSSSVVSGPYSNVTPQTYFVYDAATLNGTAMSNVAGSIAEAYTCTGSCSTKLTDTYFSSVFEMSGSNKTGRMTSQIWESTPNSGGYYHTLATSYPNGSPGILSANLSGASIGLPYMTYGVDSLGRPNTATDSTNSLNLVTGLTYNNLTNSATAITMGNGDADTWSFDANTNRPTAFKYAIAGSSPFSISGALTWNPNASLKTFTLTDSSDSTKNQNCGYSMDDLNRLSTANCSGSWAQNFTYDPFGNISKAGPTNPQQGQITSTYAAGYNAMTNQVNSGVSAAYDMNGNQTLAETNNLSWNAASQPVNVNGISGTYDAQGRLVETGLALAGTENKGSIAISGTEQMLGTYKATVTITVGGAEKSATINDSQGCGGQVVALTQTTETCYDNGGGGFGIELNSTEVGHGFSYTYSKSTDTASSIATGLTNAINATSTAGLNAAQSNGVITLTIEGTYDSGNAFDAGGSGGCDGAYFNPCSFTLTYPGDFTPTLVGQPTSVDTGQVTATISGHEASYTYGQSDTPTTIATGLAAAINSVDHGFVTATSSGSTISWSSTSGTNDPIAVNVWSNNNQFAHPSFTATATNTGTGGSGASTAYTQFVYSPGGQKIAVVSGGKLVKGTVPLPGGGSAVYNAAGLEFIRHKDWLGSSRLATTWGHAVYAKEAYAPFGETYNEAGTPDRSFTGQDQDTSTGVFDYLFRKYDPVSGRWLSPDPSGWNAASISVPQSLNRYAYVENNPMNAIDPSGLCLFAGQDDASGDPNVPCTLDSIDPYVPDASYNGDAPAPGFFYFDLNTKDDSPGVADVGTGDAISKLSKAQCQGLNTVLSREAQYGTQVAAIMSSVTGGSSTLSSFNTTNIQTPSGEIDVDWFTDLQQIRSVNLVSPFGVALSYAGLKSVWTLGRALTGYPIGYYAPFTDPGEANAVLQISLGKGFSDVFNPNFMQQACGGH